MNKSRRSLLKKENQFRGEGSKKKSNRLVFLSISGLDNDKFKKKEKSNFTKTKQTNKYWISNKERIILRDSIVKLGLLKMDNNRLLNEIEKYKKENENLKNQK